MPDSAVIVIGAGPVGMLAALLASSIGNSVIVLEREKERSLNSRAIGVTPPTLEIFKSLGLDWSLISRGITVKSSEAHCICCRLGSLDFSCLRGEYKFILSVAQDKTESLLEESISGYPNLRLFRGYEVKNIEVKNIAGGESVAEVTGTDCNGSRFSFESEYAIACDGGKSIVRNALGIRFEGHRYRDTFLMADFDDTTGWGSSARLYFTPRGSVESFPLARGRRRYVLRTPRFIREYTGTFIEDELPLRSGIDVSGAVKHWESGFGVSRFLAKRFAAGRVFLCGDAAHLMSPIGGQNMNTGFADAELAVWLIGKLRKSEIDENSALSLYHRVRRKAANAAASRAWFMMRIGTSGGRVWSWVRNLAIIALLKTPLSKVLAPVFSMQSIPFTNLSACRSKYEKELF